MTLTRREFVQLAAAMGASLAASLWKPSERPVLRQQVLEGDSGLSI